jgi:hypothetical protein
VDLQKDLCGHLAGYIKAGYIDRWITAANDASVLSALVGTGSGGSGSEEPDSLFSTYTYKGSKGGTRRQYLEPLALALRHPKAFCNDDGTYLCRTYEECRARKER